MIGRPMNRRQMLLAGMAGLGSLAAFRDLLAGPASGAPAAAAGTLTIGGDLTVNRMGFGAMRLTGEGIWGAPKDPAEARRVLRRAVDLGVNFIDTADAYGPEVNERIIAETLHPYPRGLVIATKGGQTRPSAAQWVPDGRPEHLRAACESSLKRLKLERIDLYQFHSPDPDVPVEESVGELARLRKEGKIRHVGVSNFSVDELQRVRRIVPIVSVQNRYNVADRASEEVLAICTREGIAFIPWAPVASGSTEKLVSDGLEAVAKQHGVSVFQVALAWLLKKSPVMLPIPGTSSVAHLEDNVGAAGLKLSAEDLARLG
jgi:aryl-alcohol dehydrogenase-like predicted oxidoreductase